jgi:hypothetical protein
MDQIVRTIMWIALFGGTGAVILVALPQVVIWCLEIVEGIQKAKSQRKALLASSKAADEAAQAPPRVQQS